MLLASPLGIIAQPGPSSSESQSACIRCHAEIGEEGAELVAKFREGVHAKVGLSCHNCHGGNPDPALSEDMAASMDEGAADSPFRYLGGRDEVAAFCGRCHSDPTYMRRFQPSPRVDQEREYWTSQHGIALRAGVEQVATCLDCHDYHGILPVEDSRSPVHPLRVAETCRSCHADAERMAESSKQTGSAIGFDQYARWRQSVHARALLERQDLSAPTCNDCHGNHGAAPPGVESVAFVCGSCHGREAELFRASAKKGTWEVHAAFLEESGADLCDACHESERFAPHVKKPHAFSECASCHGNHAIVRPTLALLSPLPETPCALCHEGTALSTEPSASSQSAQRYRETRDDLLQRGAEQGLAGTDLFNWMVERCLDLPMHSVYPSREAGKLRPEFETLFRKFRIGPTRYVYADPETGAETSIEVVRCTDCHNPEEGGQGFLERISALTALTAHAERRLLAAKRGGVETREAFLEIDKAVDAQISLEVLIHSFDLEGAFSEQHRTGLDHAEAALESAEMAHSELSSRYRGLAITLIIVLALLLALGLKIRELPSDEA